MVIRERDKPLFEPSRRPPSPGPSPPRTTDLVALTTIRHFHRNLLPAVIGGVARLDLQPEMLEDPPLLLERGLNELANNLCPHIRHCTPNLIDGLINIVLEVRTETAEVGTGSSDRPVTFLDRLAVHDDPVARGERASNLVLVRTVRERIIIKPRCTDRTHETQSNNQHHKHREQSHRKSSFSTFPLDERIQHTVCWICPQEPYQRADKEILKRNLILKKKIPPLVGDIFSHYIPSRFTEDYFFQILRAHFHPYFATRSTTAR